MQETPIIIKTMTGKFITGYINLFQFSNYDKLEDFLLRDPPYICLNNAEVTGAKTFNAEFNVIFVKKENIEYIYPGKITNE